ncbi:MAG: CDGSH iron-sulfur domain-containing protein [Anaerolineae bacterium]|jgi:CDGSH-type Zn-finger protein
MTKLSIRGRENGPYMIEAKVRYVDINGEEQVKTGKTVSLCRCGGSCRKPLCDGAHRKIEFEAPATEVWIAE